MSDTTEDYNRSFFFFNDTATTEIYTLSLHDALPIAITAWSANVVTSSICLSEKGATADRKSTRLNSSHGSISYAVICLKKKKTNADRHRAARRRSRGETEQGRSGNS